MSGFRQRPVTGRSEVVIPLIFKDFWGEPPDEFDRPVSATGIGDNDFANHGSDTLQSAFDPILFILNDHAERNTHVRAGIKQVGDQAQIRRFLPMGNFCLMSEASFPDKPSVGLAVLMKICQPKKIMEDF
jgi:hypothetical protein